ncbi:hypothetical protein K3495_g12334 [Podosphaera aphanis]|nr:hypothetical protein K3495_g12334 [Podosphaera aphanis]
MADYTEGDIKMTDVVSEQKIMEAEKKRSTPGYVVGHIMKFEKFADEVVVVTLRSKCQFVYD